MRTVTVLSLCALAIALSVIDLRHFEAGQARAQAMLEEYDLKGRYPNLEGEVGRRYDPVEAQLRVAQALLNDELDRTWVSELEPAALEAEIARGPERLTRAEESARQAWPRRPASWLAPTLVGGASYLRLLRAQDPRLMGESELWEVPLLAARRLGPAETGPARFLAAAYVGNWSSLDSDQRERTREILEAAFLDRQTFRLLIQDWLRIAPSRQGALEIVPDEPWAWQALQGVFSTAQDWERFAEARRRWYKSLETDADRVLESAAEQIALGEVVDTRSRLLRLASRLPRSLDFSPRFERLLELLPAGPVAAGSAEVFSSWLSWSLDLCQLADCPFPTPLMARLARLAGNLEPSRRAAALLVAGDATGAALLERRFAPGATREWAPYFLLKTKRMAARGEARDARASLAAVAPSRQKGIAYWRTAAEIARLAQDARLERRAKTELELLRSDSWSGSAWSSEAGVWTLTLLPDGEFETVEIEIAGGSSTGAVFEVSWDEQLIDIRRSSRSSERLRFELPVTPEPHRLTVRVHPPQSIGNGVVRLL